MHLKGRIIVKCKIFCNKHGPNILNFISPLWFLNCIAGLNYLANTEILDYLYGTSTWLALLTKLLSTFMSFEMLINWVFLCTVKSHYVNTEENNDKRLQHEKCFPHFNSEGIVYEELKDRRPTLGTGNWSVITHHKDGEVTRTAYPYWSWKPCIVCSFHKPPRCHHCPMCNVCVLKRDHHCFFARQCIGLNNQRFFLVFNFWAVCLTAFAIPQFWYFFYVTAWQMMTWGEAFLPWTLIKCLMGTTSFYNFYLILQLYSLIFFIMTAATFLYEQLQCVDKGMTSFELEKKDEMIETECKSRYERFACVFGRRALWVNLLIPYHWISEPTDDGISWDSIKKE